MKGFLAKYLMVALFSVSLPYSVFSQPLYQPQNEKPDTLANAKNVSNNSIIEKSVEEQRIVDAKTAMPNVFNVLKSRVETFEQQIKQARNVTALTQVVIRHARLLWQEGVTSFEQTKRFDDRSLYWARLSMSAALRAAPAFKEALYTQQQALMWKFELISRGQQDISFNKNSDKKMLVTGFDPFFLDRNIRQSNPSGVAALALDDLLISKDGISVEIETLILPVRFADFDQGMVEALLSPYFNEVDYIITVSMGRTDFDLERFPGLRRSAHAPDNLNMFTGATKKDPMLPSLNNHHLDGPEFIEFSLPVKAMSNAAGPFAINDNRSVTTVTGPLTVEHIMQLQKRTSVEGSGGGYLSNEVSYRSLLLRDQLNPMLAVGHIHTPSIKGYEPQKSKSIIQQLKKMLQLAITDK
ncbi:hypothetical protein [Thalassotalea hakodatensis]|uniref:hypothetical protein n=1 Tax=Thalassotalea hakodatensis TaxID=3030492 RepID=UPI0025724831|nr:hypothetical protein [Thalassotalea hakodatensis]